MPHAPHVVVRARTGYIVHRLLEGSGGMLSQENFEI